MQVEIKQSIIHQFYANDGQIGLRLAPDVLAIDSEVELLLNELTEVFQAKPSKGYARFITAEDSDAEQLSEFPPTLLNWHQQQTDFNAFAKQAAQMLLSQFQHYGIVEPGFLLLSHYIERGCQQLVVAYLPSRDGVTVAPDLTVDRSSQLDLAKLQLAAIINLTEWQEEPDNTTYITFIKGRVGRKVSDFFLDFMGCAEGLDAKKQSQQLVQSLQQYVHEEGLDADVAKQVRQKAYELCQDNWQQNNPVSVSDFSAKLQEDIPTERTFEAFNAAQEIPIAESFPVDRTSLRKLVKFQGQGGGLSIGFDQELLGARVEYDVEHDRLTIHGTPPNLRDQLRRYFGIDS
ncbi:nucleoid-associated protein YejK [Pseudidiomarina taiwanensis]|uniref:Nucleoid-associated protein YejK n=1 Tax=Pseudidiomarina taiwanensis TaxID=337250 RepID=A0A432ZN44_9GAMM|nr:nucleoid-associated protein YejK [Pseudidiomarina taiwanensis]RUO79315.1 nucleoid-associated protein YejK [Pseudidiomarina taiwanensis]